SFRAKVSEALQSWLSEGNPYPGGAVRPEEFHLLIAEHAINRKGEFDLPSYYTDSEFWKRHHRQLVTTFASFLKTRDEGQAISKSLNDLLRIDQDLLDKLSSYRSSTCKKYGLPHDPYPPALKQLVAQQSQ